MEIYGDLLPKQNKEDEEWSELLDLVGAYPSMKLVKTD